jgi:hypothetical protein
MGTKRVKKDMTAWKEEIRQDENLLAYYQAEVKKREQAESNLIRIEAMFNQFSLNDNKQNTSQMKLPRPYSPSSFFDAKDNKNQMEID